MPVAKKVKSVTHSYLLAVLTGLVFLLAGGLTHASKGWLEGIIAVGEGENERAITFNTTGEILSSHNGEVWRRVYGNNGNLFLAAGVWAKDPNDATKLRVIIVGRDNTVLWSEDAESFDEKTKPNIAKGDLVGVAWTGKRAIVIDRFGDIATSKNNGLTWKKQKWKKQQASNIIFNGIVWTGKQAVIVGNNGLILTSPDGKNWKQQDSGTERDLGAVAWSGTTIFVGGRDGQVLSSKDGITWEQMEGPNLSLYIGAIVSDTLGNILVSGSVDYAHFVYQQKADGGWRQLNANVDPSISVRGLAVVFGELHGVGFRAGSSDCCKSRIVRGKNNGNIWEVFMLTVSPDKRCLTQTEAVSGTSEQSCCLL